MSYYSRSWTERIKIQIEIFGENCVDYFGHAGFRRPLMFLAGAAVLVTLKNSRNSISMVKSATFGAQPKKSWSSFFGFSSRDMQYGSGISSYNRLGTGQPYGSYASQGMQTNIATQPGVSSPLYGSSSQYGGQTNLGYNTASTLQSHGANTANALRGNSLSSPPLSQGTLSASTGFKTSDLVDTNGANVQVVQGGLFHDYGSSTGFMGQIETVSAIEAPSFVSQILKTQGMGKILVVDGGGSLNGAVLDGIMANSAQMNGWKGIIINGVVRDADSLKMQQIGIKATGTHPQKGQQNVGQQGIPLSFGGVNFNPGSWVYADKDGIVVSQQSLVGANTSPGISSPQKHVGQVGSSMTGNSLYNPSQPYPGATTAAATTTTPTYGSQTAYSGMTPGGLKQPYQNPPQYGSANGASYSQRPMNSYSSNLYAQRRKKPSKKKVIGLLLLIGAIVFVCVGD